MPVKLKDIHRLPINGRAASRPPWTQDQMDEFPKNDAYNEAILKQCEKSIGLNREKLMEVLETTDVDMSFRQIADIIIEKEHELIEVKKCE